MHEMDAADFRRVIDIDLNAPFIVAKAVLPAMMEKRAGKIINICSMMSELGRETVSALSLIHIFPGGDRYVCRENTSRDRPYIRPVSGRRMPDDRLHRKGHYRLCYRC